MKTPDCLDLAANDAGLDGEERDKFMELCERWFDWGECITLEVDTETGNILVKKG